MPPAVSPRRLTDPREILARLQSDRLVHLYEIGDLDPFFFPSCAYYEDGASASTVLVYRGDAPTVLALSRDAKASAALLDALAPELPERFEAHLAVSVLESLGTSFAVRHSERHQKWALGARDAIERAARVASSVPCERVHPRDVDAVWALYRESYPGTWFSPRMLETGAYFGVREDGRFLAIAGVHVLARAERVAVLGNVTTSPAARGRGLAKAACASVIAALAPDVDAIGLNVASDNEAAIRLYRSLGFSFVCDYVEATIERA